MSCSFGCSPRTRRSGRGISPPPNVDWMRRGASVPVRQVNSSTCSCSSTPLISPSDAARSNRPTVVSIAWPDSWTRWGSSGSCSTALIEINRASLLLAEGKAAKAREALVAAMRTMTSRPDRPDLATPAELLARLYHLEGDALRAAAALGLSEAIRGAFDRGNPALRELVGLLTEELGEQAYTAAYSETPDCPNRMPCGGWWSRRRLSACDRRASPVGRTPPPRRPSTPARRAVVRRPGRRSTAPAACSP